MYMSFQGYVYYQLVEIELDSLVKNELAIQAFKHLNFNLEDNDQDVLYTMHIYLLINDITGLITYLEDSQVTKILKEHEWYFKDHIKELVKHPEFCLWFKKVFNRDFGT